MKNQINARENFDRMMRRQAPAWLPLDMPVTAPVRQEIEQRSGGRSPIQAFDLDFDQVGVDFAHDHEAWRRAFSDIGFALPVTAHVGGYGITHDTPPLETLGTATHLRQMLHPLSCLQRVEQLPGLPWPDVSARNGETLAPSIARVQAAGRVAVASMECTIFEHAWYVRGMAELFTDLHDGNGIGQWLLDFFTRRSVTLARTYAAAGVDVIGLGDDVGTQHGMMMAPDFWRLHLKPRLAAVIDAVREHQANRRVWIRYHSDGDISPIIEDLIEIGVDILNPIQPECMPLEQVVSRYAGRVAFWGMVGTQTTMPYGSPGEVYATVAAIAEHARHGAAVVVAPTHVLEPDVPWTNIEALAAATREIHLDATRSAFF